MQIHTDVVGSAVAFGYGSSPSFTETMRIKGNGNLQVVGNVTAAKFLGDGSGLTIGNKLDTSGGTMTGALTINPGLLKVQANHNDTTPNIAAFFAQNLTQGIGIGYNRIAAVGNNADQDILLVPKGNGNVGIGTVNPSPSPDQGQ